MPFQKTSTSETEDIDYMTKEWPKNRDEISIAIALDHYELAEISLLRPKQEGFEAQDIENLKLIEAITAPVIPHYWHEYAV